MFSHGQLYVGMSRVSRPENITVFLDRNCKLHNLNGTRKYTKNVVHDEVIHQEKSLYMTSPQYLGPDIFNDSNFVVTFIINVF